METQIVIGATDNSAVRVLVLGGGPDSEREVSLESSKCVAEALKQCGYKVRRDVIARVTASEIRGVAADVIFPVLHGPWGEGGPLQDVLEEVGRAYVGCRPAAARIAMDKMATKLAASRCGVETLPACVLNLDDDAPPMELPLVVKPIHEGSSVGVHICRDRDGWERAIGSVLESRRGNPTRAYMVERAVIGAREVTVGVIDDAALPIIEIKPSVEFYDYEAKYSRSDTRYVISPNLPGSLSGELPERALRVSREIGVRHLCRIDFLIDADGRAWLLEVNTMPGFTSHSLVPMAGSAAGMDFPALTSRLVRMALRDGVAGRSSAR